MNGKRKPAGIRVFFALLLILAQLFALIGCSKQQPDETAPGSAAETTAPAHDHSFVDGLCECGQTNGFDGYTVQTDNGLTAVTREDTDSGMTLTSSNKAGEIQGIRLEKDFDAVYGHFYEIVYRFTSNVDGMIRFVSDGAAYYESNEYEVKAGENEITVRFAAGSEKKGKVHTSLELGGLNPFQLSFTSIAWTEPEADLSNYWLDVAPEQASGTMKLSAASGLTATYQTDEGWRVKLAIDRSLKKGKTYETTFVFTKSGGRAENVTYTVYDGAASVIGSKMKWVDSDVCVATFYFTANETVTKGTCLELGQLCGGEEVTLTFTYIEFKEVTPEKEAALLAANRFSGINVWTEASLASAAWEQTPFGLTVTNTNPAGDWWKVKLEKELNTTAGHYYKLTFTFDSDTTGRIKFVNDDAAYYGSNEYDVKKGKNVFSVEIKSGGNFYSCLELGGLGPFSLTFTDISIEEIDEPDKPVYNGNAASTAPATRFGSFRVWTDATVKATARKDTATTLTVTSSNEATDWWKVKLEKDLSGTAGSFYEVVYTFTSDTAGRIKFVNDDATYYGSNEYDVKVGENTFTVKFKFIGNPYSCLELGGLGTFKLTFTDYSFRKIEEPAVITNGFEGYRVWTEGSLTPATREDTADTMTVISTNEAGDWWKVKLETDLDVAKDRYYEITFAFTSDVAGPIQFINDAAEYLGANAYDVKPGENSFTVRFKAKDAAPYSCLELGGLGRFRLTFSDIQFKEIEKPEMPTDHVHSFVNGVCSCGQTNGFESYRVWTEGSLTPATREDTADTMTVISTNEAGDWWKVKLENNFTTEAGHAYETVYTFTSSAEGDIKLGVNENAACIGEDIYHVVQGKNTFTVQFTAEQDAYTCLELGGLGEFRLTFTGITLKEIEKPEEPEEPVEHVHSFINGVCVCGQTNGFADCNVWTEGSLMPATREDTESTMTVISTNAPDEWWKVKVEKPLGITEGKTYEVTFNFTSNANGTIKYSVNGATFDGINEYNVQAGANTFTVRFTAGSETYSCLELGGLGAFRLTFTGISLEEIAEEHIHNFVNGVCSCGATNGFAGWGVWTEGSLTAATREDTESTMTVISTNAATDWWKVKLESGLGITEGKIYEVTFNFTSNAAGTIKYSVNGATFDGTNEYNVQAGANTFTVRFTAGSETYSCLELGGLGSFHLTFTKINIREIEAPA